MVEKNLRPTLMKQRKDINSLTAKYDSLSSKLARFKDNFEDKIERIELNKADESQIEELGNGVLKLKDTLATYDELKQVAKEVNYIYKYAEDFSSVSEEVKHFSKIISAGVQKKDITLLHRTIDSLEKKLNNSLERQKNQTQSKIDGIKEMIESVHETLSMHLGKIDDLNQSVKDSRGLIKTNSRDIKENTRLISSGIKSELKKLRIKEVVDEIEEIDERLDSLEKGSARDKIKAMEKKFKALYNEFNAQIKAFNASDRRMIRIEEQLSRKLVNEKLKEIDLLHKRQSKIDIKTESETDKLKDMNKKLMSEIKQLRKDVNQSNKKISSLEKKVVSLKTGKKKKGFFS